MARTHYHVTTVARTSGTVVDSHGCFATHAAAVPELDRCRKQHAVYRAALETATAARLESSVMDTDPTDDSLPDVGLYAPNYRYEITRCALPKRVCTACIEAAGV